MVTELEHHQPLSYLTTCILSLPLFTNLDQLETNQAQAEGLDRSHASGQRMENRG